MGISNMVLEHIWLGKLFQIINGPGPIKSRSKSPKKSGWGEAWSPPVRSPAPLEPPKWNDTLYRGLSWRAELPFWVLISPPEPPLAAPSFWKSGYAPEHKSNYNVPVLMPVLMSNIFMYTTIPQGPEKRRNPWKISCCFQNYNHSHGARGYF